MSWSSGKDSAWALQVLKQRREYEVAGLLTTFNQAANRVAMHAVRRELVEAQAEAAGIPLWPVELPWPCGNADYEAAMRAACSKAVAQGIEAVAFGDLFLEDVRAYREKQLQGSGLTPIFPLWKIPTDQLAHDMISGGLRARITCIDPKQAPRSWAGQVFDGAFLEAIPRGIDPCGERGEFHTFVYDGPMLRHPVEVVPGKIVEREGFVFADLLPGSQPDEDA